MKCSASQEAAFYMMIAVQTSGDCNLMKRGLKSRLLLSNVRAFVSTTLLYIKSLFKTV